MKEAETKHELIEKYYIDLLENNKVSAGEQLPSENDIAKQFNVSRHTVRQALNYLVQEGWIYKERGKGSFYSNKKQNEIKKNVAVLTTYISDYIFPKIISGIEEELRRKGYNLLLFNSNNDINNERICFENIINQDIAGLIVEPAQSTINNLHHESIKKLEKNNIKYIAINANCDEENSAYILVDDEQGGYKLTNYLLELGHRNIAALFKADDLQGEKRRRGYIKALTEYNLSFNKKIVGEYITDNQEMYIDQFIKRILSSENRPTAIVCYNDKVALRVIDECRKENIKIPKDLSIVSFDDSSLAVSSDIKLTTIKHPKEDMGVRAAKCVIDMIEGRIDKPQYTYSAELIVRESCSRVELQ
ncbi:GntR family transcriptional regulator of arabinose operon [Clostridium saccharoperbutylacetonicum]|uniref:Arabinose metabolism transcriptional repressor AraR n=1 Tax=Clostridium saccharoperbutylacetonicum N1-4(HMT) TaxID=931276 RepID=M1MUT9_9CLOT|nr:GntR family transcriptional regulator [Clostridium saccharoperbutylacetonicum]AGF58446.1 arabinose metabolism transcriptional repressor AraR [Clostridium saccharoperbutylacetonicum N1-4(HMT)]NRT60776.1 GntR family transcriptional regulator of arabinose operon [Clostridium saccharoperbutylacetonicum]NSB24090.1 GntR family transcriptional regulator of arabinose operon [Clostridium saccharoperbutylacetonicum]NSB43468.1 GntR family transcriptional regulator of arabinose operon [Clostridium sacch